MKILVPTDFTEISENGLKVARDIALKGKADIFLINYIEPVIDSDFSATGDSTKPTFEAQAYMIEQTKRNSQLIHELALKYESDEINIKPVIEVDYFENAMEHFIKDRNIDLVVMGTSGERSFDELIFGNHTERIIKISSCPVLSVKQYDKKFEPKSLVLALDLETESPVELSYFKEFALWFEATVHFIHVVKSKKSLTDKLQRYLDMEVKEYDFPKYTTTLRANRKKEVAIAEFAKEKQADLIGVVSRARNSVVNLFLGSFSESLVKDSSTPALTMTVNMEKNN